MLSPHEMQMTVMLVKVFFTAPENAGGATDISDPSEMFFMLQPTLLRTGQGELPAAKLTLEVAGKIFPVPAQQILKAHQMSKIGSPGEMRASRILSISASLPVLFFASSAILSGFA